MPTDRPVPVSINQSPNTIFFSLPVTLKSSEFHLLLCFARFFPLSTLISSCLLPVLACFFFHLTFLLPLQPSLSLASYTGLWPSCWPGRLFSNVLPDQSRLWNSSKLWIMKRKLIQNYVLNTFQHRHTGKVCKQAGWLTNFSEVTNFWKWIDQHFSGPERPGKWGSGFSTSW